MATSDNFAGHSCVAVLSREKGKGNWVKFPFLNMKDSPRKSSILRSLFPPPVHNSVFTVVSFGFRQCYGLPYSWKKLRGNWGQFPGYQTL